MSPINVIGTHSNTTDPDDPTRCEGPCYFPWWDFSFAFIPNYWKVKINETTSGPKDYVYQIQVEDSPDGRVQGLFSSEPFKTKSQKQVTWDIDHIRFHYPAENQFDGKQYDLEM